MVVVLGYERREDILYESLNLLNSFPFISSPEKICAFHHKKKNHCSNNREVNVQIVINGVIFCFRKSFKKNKSLSCTKPRFPFGLLETYQEYVIPRKNKFLYDI